MGEIGITEALTILTIYFVPTFVAYIRNTPNKNKILVFNLLLGWTFIGLVGVLIWACITKKPNLLKVKNNAPLSSEINNEEN